MAHIILTPDPTDSPAMQLTINGFDFSREVFSDFRLVSVGDDPEFAEVGFQVTFAVGRLDLGGDTDVAISGDFTSVAQRVHAMAETGTDACQGEVVAQLRNIERHLADIASGLRKARGAGESGSRSKR